MKNAKTVAMYTRKGGVGKTTLAFILACYGAARRKRVILVSMDPQGDGPRWASGGDRQLIPGDLFRSELGFDVLFSPGEMPDLSEGKYDIVVVDLPPDAGIAAMVHPALWVTLVDGRDAVLDTMPVFKKLMAEGAPVMLVLNKWDSAGVRVHTIIREGLEKLEGHHDNVLLADNQIPQAGSVARVSSYYQPPWSVPFGKGTKGAISTAGVCSEVFELLEQGA